MNLYCALFCGISLTRLSTCSFDHRSFLSIILLQCVYNIAFIFIFVCVGKKREPTMYTEAQQDEIMKRMTRKREKYHEKHTKTQSI